MLFRIKTVIAEGVEILFVNMDDKPADEFKGRDGLMAALSIFMAAIPERDVLSVVIGNARLRHSRSADIPCDVICDGFGRIKVRFGSMDIETVLVAGIHSIF